MVSEQAYDINKQAIYSAEIKNRTKSALRPRARTGRQKLKYTIYLYSPLLSATHFYGGVMVRACWTCDYEGRGFNSWPCAYK